MLGRSSHPACAVKWRTRSKPCVMRLRAVISRGCAVRQMTWSAPCSASARKSTVRLEQPQAMEQPAQHLVVKLGPSRENSAKSRRTPALVSLERAQGYRALSRETRASLKPHEQDAVVLVGATF